MRLCLDKERWRFSCLGHHLEEHACSEQGIRDRQINKSYAILWIQSPKSLQVLEVRRVISA
ncbi:hypothetical protein E2C01_006037 [Portunus trituberculatus]|uniref:Uncharacterized protein n=1 Tax=Portunus trituberculatus TaxID=210409 RepID=A0A5B7CY70_PORTR|nr:hypothetical protein [Portunus trituberculatus]